MNLIAKLLDTGDLAKLLDTGDLAKLLPVSTEYCAIIKKILRKRKNAYTKKNVIWALYNNHMSYCPYDLELYKTSDDALEYVYDRCFKSQIYDDVFYDRSMTDHLTDSFGELYNVPTFDMKKEELRKSPSVPNFIYRNDPNFFPDGEYGLIPLFGYDIRKTFYVIEGGNGHFQELTQNSDRAKELEEKYVVREHDFN